MYPYGLFQTKINCISTGCLQVKLALMQLLDQRHFLYYETPVFMSLLVGYNNGNIAEPVMRNSSDCK